MFELLKINHKPDNYQTNAVLAAKTILKERTISEADLIAVKKNYSEIETTEIERNNNLCLIYL